MKHEKVVDEKSLEWLFVDIANEPERHLHNKPEFHTDIASYSLEAFRTLYNDSIQKRKKEAAG